ncbi:hypothetical protein SAMN05444515_11555 [Ectothiorhodospira marina]|uniref:Uncharacterized protein n=1 Tax=Ectothiorhodospira marina TaxID=1396821 RepID=A0A1H7PYG4_9GAMM|nr:hypothetical protein SAMN05444515_11555 [Ectothiorhodospira marina]
MRHPHAQSGFVTSVPPRDASLARASCLPLLTLPRLPR